jgi:phospholipid/cholesterol/gamma-HCH transport system substrate-binding protein
MKAFQERNPLFVGMVGISLVLAITLAALNYTKLPFLGDGKSYTAYFAEAGGLFTGASVEVSGYPTGKVSAIDLDGDQVRVSFQIDDDVFVGDRSEARIRAKSALGTKVLEVLPRGEAALDGPIPRERTQSPYQLPDAVGDLAKTIDGLDTAGLSDSLATIAQTFADTPESVRAALRGVSRLADTLNARDANLRTLLTNAHNATTVLADRTGQVVRLLHDSNLLLAELRTQSAALSRVWTSLSAAAQQLRGFVAENRQTLKPTLERLNGVLTIIDNRKQRVQAAIKGLGTYAFSLGESLGSGPFFKAYVVNLLPGQFVQPFVEAAFSDLGLDPATLLPSQLTDPQVGQRATPPLPMPMPRTGQGGEPKLNLPDAITGNADPNLPAQSPGRYPYREPLPAPEPGGPPPGPPAQPAAPDSEATP